MSKNTSEFWSSWKHLYSKNKSDLHTVVNGETEKKEIANAFQKHFVKVSLPNNHDRVNQLNEDFRNKYNEVLEAHNDCSCSLHKVTLETVLDATFRMKKGKSCDDSHISVKKCLENP